MIKIRSIFSVLNSQQSAISFQRSAHSKQALNVLRFGIQVSGIKDKMQSLPLIADSL